MENVANQPVVAINPGIKYLKVKIKSLAAEARTIRKEERSAKEQRQTALLTSLHLHRVGPVRYEARVSLLAYGVLRGKTRKQIEGKVTADLDLSYEEHNLRKRVGTLIKKYGTPEDVSKYTEMKALYASAKPELTWIG